MRFAVIAVSCPAALLCAGCGDCNKGQTQAYPSRPIKLVVPFGPGGGTDSYARIIKKAIEDHDLLPQPLVVINRGGAGATIGSRYVKNAAPDGYTVLILHDAMMTAQAFGIVPYGPEAFDPVAATGEVGLIIAVANGSPYQSLNDLMEDAARRPGKITFGMNIGAVTHFAGLQLERAHPGGKARFRYVPLGGGGERIAHLNGGHIDVTGFSVAEFVDYRASGIRGLAYFGEQPHPAAPNMKTARQQGYPIAARNTFYWWVPKGTPQERKEIIAEALQKTLETEYAQEKLKQIHTDPVFLTGDDLMRRIEQSRREIMAVAPEKTTVGPNLPAVVLSAIGAVGIGMMIMSRRRSGESRALEPAEKTISSSATDNDDNTTELPANNRRLAVTSVVTLFSYAFVLDAGWLGFRSATALCVFALCVLLARDGRRWRTLTAAAVLAVFLSLGVHWVFTDFLSVDLP